MVEPKTCLVACQDPGDGSGDAIIELPSALLDGLGWGVGDELILEHIEGVLSLKRKLSPSEPTD
ncbi:AbrB/MazE/SpoVT family DNA-binding domain-containing protein [Pseudomonas aeruginosa]|uniref:AbrB/MazE/SpoVT family DNA-binding domain-containing protein n=1 Tax=Pseudomonas aeruginosa TaxID=287 RepID=UPI002A6ADEDB|nr:AbrB/MazE/SpoVT family DNA-binding domain-containing protein [Pseudomonas aeruginosa]MDY1247764.1 AbrB/MazE/SpoVT family DNA-binding domain-containing protein [Pseudomonas aeruginosa]HCF9805908.1 AbrB/MazE/SpoVT family DNA-binding domain-containing protein [Pseudomonas aeruginosa]